MTVKVKKRFRDKNTQEIYRAGSEIELTAKRVKEISKKLGDEYIETIDPDVAVDASETQDDDPKTDAEEAGE